MTSRYRFHQRLHLLSIVHTFTYLRFSISFHRTVPVARYQTDRYLVPLSARYSREQALHQVHTRYSSNFREMLVMIVVILVPYIQGGLSS